MDQQEIDRIVAECKKITDEFRKKVELNNNRVNGADIFLTGSIDILNYVGNIQNILDNSKFDKNIVCDRISLNLSNLHINEPIQLRGSLPRCFFNNTRFGSWLVFEEVIFLSSVFFNQATFNQSVDFYKVVFKDSANFNTAVFQDKINCSGALFSSTVDFANASFYKEVNFSDSEFKKVTIFRDATFLQKANFNSTIFQSLVDFTNSRFEREASFNKARFNKETDFSNVRFLSWASFEEIISNREIDFRTSVFSWWASFQKAQFYDFIGFNDVEFKSSTKFTNTEFNFPPLFHNAKLHQDTSFEGAEFERCEKEDDYRAYRTLKQHMNSVHATLEESRFFALEQRTRLKLDEELYQKGKKELLSNIIISKFYAGISDYGQDTLKPILLLVGMWLLFGLLFSLPHMVEVNPEYSKIAWIAPFNDSNWFMNIIKGLGYSFQSTFNPLSLFAKDIPFVAQNIIVLILAYIELLCAITFITLWLFAVRRRFQKGE